MEVNTMAKLTNAEIIDAIKELTVMVFPQQQVLQ